jgi:hypothetical protein
MDADYSDLNLVGYLYNGCYGGFGFSDKFKKRIIAKRGPTSHAPKDHFREDRSDPEYIALFNELGAKASSGDFASLKIRYFPEEFLEFVNVHEYDGLETVGISEPEVYAGLLKNFLAERKRNPELTLDDLETRYTATKAKLARYNEYLNNVVWKRKDD